MLFFGKRNIFWHFLVKRNIVLHFFGQRNTLFCSNVLFNSRRSNSLSFHIKLPIMVLTSCLSTQFSRRTGKVLLLFGVGMMLKKKQTNLNPVKKIIIMSKSSYLARLLRELSTTNLCKVQYHFELYFQS